MNPQKDILIVEDEMPIRVAICYQLRELGNLIQARNYADAFRQIVGLPQSEIALAVVDIRIGDPNGLQVIEYLQAQPYGCNTAIIVLTIFNDMATIKKVKEFPSVKYLINKPWNSATLIKAAAECLQGHAGGFSHLGPFS